MEDILISMCEFEDDLEIGDICCRKEYAEPLWFEVIALEGTFYRLREANRP